MENNVKKIYLCSYGENTLDLPVVDYNDYEELHKQLQQAKAELKQYKKSKQASYEAMQDKWNKAVLENRELKAENEKLREELKSVENDRKWIKEKCIDAGKELGKHSFAWDGKEKNLVVQAMQLNEMYEKLKAENEELKNKNNSIHSIADGLQQRNHNLTLENESYEYQLEKRIEICDSWFCLANKYKTALDEIEEIARDFHLSMIIFHKGTTHKMADIIDDYLDKIKQLIKQVKEGNVNGDR